MSGGGVDQAGHLYFDIFLLRLWICDSIQLIIISFLYKDVLYKCSLEVFLTFETLMCVMPHVKCHGIKRGFAH